MASINLLPGELVLKKGTVETSSLIKQITIIGFVLLSLSILGLIGYFLILSSEYNAVAQEEEQLKQNIQALEATEQGLYLAKDRLAGIKKVTSGEYAEYHLEKLINLSSLFPPEVSVTEIEITGEGVEIIIFTSNATGFSNMLDVLLNSGLYENVLLMSFGFSPTVGYTASLQLS